MGFNSVLLIMNDALSAIESDPEFGKRVADAIRRHYLDPRKNIDVPIGGWCNPATVIGQEHADCIQVLAVGGNSGHRLGVAIWSDNDERILKLVAEQMGFDIRRKKGRKP